MVGYGHIGHGAQNPDAAVCQHIIFVVIILKPEFILHHIQTGSADFPALQAFYLSLGINQPASCRIDENNPVLHFSNALFIDHMEIVIC